MQGWIKLHRQLLEWEWYSDANVSRLFIHCLLKANHKDAKWKGKLIKRGQFITSLDRLCSETSLTKSQIRTSLKKLKSTHEIAHEGNSQHTVITLLCYESYQGDDTRSDTPMTYESHTDDIQIAPNKNDNNKNNDKNDNKSLVPATPKRGKFNDGDMAFVDGMLNLLIQNNPNFKQPNKNTWANEVRKIREIDGIDHAEMARVFTWASKDSFWASNILSPSKLRKQWDQLSAKSNQHKTTLGVGPRTQSTFNNLQDGF